MRAIKAERINDHGNKEASFWGPMTDEAATECLRVLASRGDIISAQIVKHDELDSAEMHYGLVTMVVGEMVTRTVLGTMQAKGASLPDGGRWRVAVELELTDLRIEGGALNGTVRGQAGVQSVRPA